jgi:hypothetical protein
VQQVHFFQILNKNGEDSMNLRKSKYIKGLSRSQIFRGLLLTKIFLILSIILYPIICMLINKDKVNESIIFYFLFPYEIVEDNEKVK